MVVNVSNNHHEGMSSSHPYDAPPRAWMQEFIAPRYSTFAEDKAMAACFLLYQQMGPPPNMNTYPEVDYRSIESPT